MLLIAIKKIETVKKICLAKSLLLFLDISTRSIKVLTKALPWANNYRRNCLLAGRHIDSWPRQVPFMLKTESTHTHMHILKFTSTLENLCKLCLFIGYEKNKNCKPEFFTFWLHISHHISSYYIFPFLTFCTYEAASGSIRIFSTRVSSNDFTGTSPRRCCRWSKLKGLNNMRLCNS